jgi:hypothetical protein
MRRPNLPVEPTILFYPQFAWQSARKAWRYWRGFREERKVLKRELEAPDR